MQGSFFSFVGCDCDGTKLNPFHSLIRLGTEVFNADAVELRVFEGLKKLFFKEGTGNTATPECWIVGKMLRHRLVADDVGNHNSSAAFEHPVHFREKRFLSSGWTRFNTQLETITSMDSSATNGCSCLICS